MVRFYPLFCRRSDGKLEVAAKGRKPELNQPTDEQLDQKPDKNGVSDFYRELSPEDAKHLDWRRKLGGMLVRELDWKDRNVPAGNGDNGYMLVALPENYRLYEHIKKTERDGKTEVKSKTHAAGGNERQDAYLYGHPEGRRKRYRSPADFFPHLLWLCTDESGDPENCSCKICSPDDPDDAETRSVGRPKSKSAPAVKVESGTSTSKVASAPSDAKEKQQLLAPSPSQITQYSRQTLVPTTLPEPTQPDQQLDLRYNAFMYRSGELVWFRRGQAWGLGAVLRRWTSPSNQCSYTVQPLSHPMAHPPTVTTESHFELRPWLAWSVPKYTYDALNNLPEPPHYGNADWQGMQSGRYGAGDLEVDASIMAAKAVDSSYTLLNSIQTRQIHASPTESVQEVVYGSMFLGAEKIWIGDALRLTPGTGTDILVLQSIIQRETAKSTQQRTAETPYLVGDIYTLTKIQHNDPKLVSPAAPSNNPQLPQRLTEDLAYRNNRSIPLQRIAAYWKLVAVQQKVELNDIKGRWYEASLILPILHPQVFEESSRKGDIQEASLWMNARGDCINSNRSPSAPMIPRQNIRQTNRLAAYGRAVPIGTQIRDGTEPPLPDNLDPALENMGDSSTMDIDPKFEIADTVNGDEIQVSRPDEPEVESLDEFMNLDGMDDGQTQMPGFGREYDSQGDSQRRFF